uniref:CKK domain-containing protein n=1 Tax=Knipowitschia caucasica TaxID=637954 RepID=A0AAV2LH89_KNICA
MCPESRLRPEGAPAGFYLHVPEKEEPTLSSSVPSGGDRPRDRSRSSDMSRDDDSVLRDGSVDSSEASDDMPRNAPGNMRPNWGGPNNSNSPNGSPRMTSFAARRDSSRKRQPAAPGEEASSSPSTATAQGPDAQALGARLEEKRRSIDAQKRRIEAIFAKHRQRLGKSAFLQLQREQGEGGDTAAGDAKEQLSLDERLTQVEEQLQRDEEKERKEQVSAPPPRLEKQVTFSLDNKEREGVAGSPGPGVQQYTEVVQKLSEALECLQKDMQKLTQQQQQLLSGQRHKLSPKIKPMPVTPVTPPQTPSKTPARSRALLIPVSGQYASTKITLLSSSCPTPRTRAVPRSPKTTSRTPTRKRPSDLAFPPLSRVLTPPQSVDSLPHLRRVSPSKCQVQTSSSFRIGGPRTLTQTPPPVAAQSEESTSDTGSSETPTQFSLELEDRDSGLVQDSPAQDLPRPVESSPSECSLQSDTLSLSAFSTGGDGRPVGDTCSLMASLSSLGPAELEGGVEEGASDEQTEFSSDSMSDLTDVTRTRESSVSASEVTVQEPTPMLPSDPRPRPTEDSQQAAPQNQCGADGHPQSDTFTADGPPQSDASSSDRREEPRGAIGLFYMDGAHREEDMAQRRAALLERQQKRSEELRRRRQWNEQETDTRSPAGLPSASSTPPATPSRRGDFTRGEYACRHQLRIMDDLDKVIKQKPATGARGKRTRARPRSVTRESTHLSLSPAKSTSAGPRLTKVYSHSSLNLPSTADSENSNSEAKKPQSRSSSPCAQGADTETGSSSGPSLAPDYTGPKLFKEPSFKSNKFIIHNALARCCLAGRVNESQKNKIVEEMEKSEAHHFLILFRDASCQFRGVYTLSPDAQELVRLTGVGPRAVPRSHIQSIYKYSSDRKQFCPIPSKTLGMSVDAFTIPAALWHGGGGVANRRASITKKSPAK